MVFSERVGPGPLPADPGRARFLPVGMEVSTILCFPCPIRLKTKGIANHHTVEKES